MVGMNGAGGYNAYAAQSEISKVHGVDKVAPVAEDKTADSKGYGRTIGKPELSDKAQKYYDQLKKKYGNYDFILVSSDQMENAKANAAKYANGFKTVVLIDEDKIEKMASDEKYRKQYEDILSGAAAQLEQIKSSMEASGANVKGYGIQVNDNGTVSFFAVLKKSSAEQRARIEHKIEANRAERKAEAKRSAEKRTQKRAEDRKAAKEEQAERLAGRSEGKDHIRENNDDNLVTISAGSVEELMSKLEEYSFNERSNSVQTESEKQIGQNIDFRG